MHAFRTVAEALANVGQLFPERGLTFQDMAGRETTWSYLEIEQMTAGRAAALQALGLQPGDRFGLVAVEPEDFVLTFLAALRIKVVPVPLYPPLSLGSLDAYAERTACILQASGCKVLIASAKLQNVLWGLVDKVEGLQRLVKVEDLGGVKGVPVWPTIEPSDIAFLQYTSGSTADPKGVVVTHANLVANAKAIAEGLQVDVEAGDKGISWLPLYHDMGLIGFVITPVVHAIPVVYIPTLRFIKRPTCWFEAMHKHKGTLTFAPNFAYALIARKAKPADLERWDLSHVKALGCGAEPIHPDTVRDFEAVFTEHCGLDPKAFLPAFGMAEATLAVTFKPMGERWVSSVVDAERFQQDGVVEAVEGDRAALEHVCCGAPLDDHEVRIVGEDGRVLPEGHEGEVCIRGPSICPGYYENPQATASALRDGWLHSGDLGYLRDGHLYVTGRLKDLIILNGRNLHPQAVEWIAMGIEGVRKGNVVAFSRPGAHSEELVVALETRTDDRARLVAEVRAAVQRELAVTVADVVCLEPGTLPKTSSGKLQRRKARQHYLQGTLGTEGSRLAGASGDRITLARHVARSMWTRAKAAMFWR